METNDHFTLLTGNAEDLLSKFDENSVDLVLTDIPYGIDLDEWDVLHNNTNSALGGQSPAQEKMGEGFKRRGKPINGWSQADLNRPMEYQSWCAKWALPLRRALKPGGSVFLFCGRRTMHRAMAALEDSGFLVRDLLAWEKPGAHHRAQSLSKLFDRRGMHDEARKWEGWRLGNLAPLFEPIVWLFKPYKIGTTIADNVLEWGVGAMNTADCQQNGSSPTNLLRFDFAPDEKRLHEAQKPVSILQYLLRLTTTHDQIVLDPFMGSGSTGVAAVRMGRKFIGIEQNPAYVTIAQDRLNRELPGRPSAPEEALMAAGKRSQSRLF